MVNVVHVMLSQGLGGIQAAAAAYANALDAIPSLKVWHVFHPDTAQAYGVRDAAEIAPVSQYDLVAIARLARIIVRQKADVIISHGKRAGTIAHLAHRISRRPAKHIHVLHRYRFAGLERFDTVWCVTKDLQAAVPQDVQAVHMPLWIDTVPQNAARPHNAVPVIGFLGRFVPEKGADILLNALPQIPQAHVRLGGDGAEKPVLEKIIQEKNLANRVAFLGWVQDKAAFYAGIDVLCVPSRMESFGLVVLEAWAHGVPVVALNAPGPREIITHNETGMLCVESELPQVLNTVLSDENLRNSLVNNAAKALGTYTEQAAIQRMKAALQVD